MKEEKGEGIGLLWVGGVAAEHLSATPNGRMALSYLWCFQKSSRMGTAHYLLGEKAGVPGRGW